MEWIDEGIVLGVKRHGETSVILELMTQAHGRHLGLVRGGAGTRMRGVLQPGNALRATWRARLDEHLGHYAVEGLNLRAGAFLPAAHAVHGVTHLAALCRLLAEREPHAAIYHALDTILDFARRPGYRRGDDRALRTRLSGRAGLRPRPFVLRRDRHDGRPHLCVAEIRPRGLAVRPARPIATGCCGSPAFCRAVPSRHSPDDLADAFALTGFFLDRHAFAPRGLALPEARAHFVAALTRVSH